MGRTLGEQHYEPRNGVFSKSVMHKPLPTFALGDLMLIGDEALTAS
jgi:hypothetical protein